MFLKRLLTICKKSILQTVVVGVAALVLRNQSSKYNNGFCSLYYHYFSKIISSLTYIIFRRDVILVIFFLLVCIVVFLYVFVSVLSICAYLFFLSFCFCCITGYYIITFSRGLLNAPYFLR